MRKKIRNVLAVAAAIITVLSINPLFSMADMPDEPIVIEWINEHGYVYYNNADEAYSAISDYLKDAWPAYEEYNGGVLLNGGIKVLYQGGPSDRIESLHDTYSSNGLFNDLKKSMLSNIVKEYGGITVNGEAYTGYYATNVFTHANEFRESLTQDEYNQGVAKAAQLADQFNYGSDYEKALRTYNYITSNIAYDWSKSTGSIYTALINNNTVCLGYAEAFFEICNNMGLEVYIVTVPQHAYNIINLDGQYYIVTDRWQNFTDEAVTTELLDKLSSYCCEFLVHAVDVEGRVNGIEKELVAMLGSWGRIPFTYAGGVSSFDDLKCIRQLGQNHLNVTIGSALDLFGGEMEYDKVIAFCNNKEI